MSEELAKRILGSMRTKFSGEQTSRWLSNLDDLPERLNPDGAKAIMQATPIEVNALIDKIFNDLDRYTFEFNKNPVGSDLMVQCERPTTMHETAVGTHYGDKPLLAQGHICTRYFAMVLRVWQEKIMAYTMPAENVVAFSLGQGDEFEPFLEIDPDYAPTGQVWKVGEELITPASLPNLTKRLFSALIKVANGEHTYDDPLGTKSAPKNQPIDPSAMPPSYRDNEKFELWTPETMAAEQHAHANPANNYQAPKPVPAPIAKPEPIAAPPLAKLSALTSESDDAVANAFSAFLAVLDEQLNHLTQIGIKVLQEQDIETMQSIMRKTSTLKSAKEKIIESAQEWQKS
jgi:hypothetical protein